METLIPQMLNQLECATVQMFTQLSQNLLMRVATLPRHSTDLLREDHSTISSGETFSSGLEAE